MHTHIIWDVFGHDDFAAIGTGVVDPTIGRSKKIVAATGVFNWYGPTFPSWAYATLIESDDIRESELDHGELTGLAVPLEPCEPEYVDPPPNVLPFRHRRYLESR